MEAVAGFFSVIIVLLQLLLCYYTGIDRVLTFLGQTPPVHPVPDRGIIQ